MPAQIDLGRQHPLHCRVTSLDLEDTDPALLSKRMASRRPNPLRPRLDGDRCAEVNADPLRIGLPCDDVRCQEEQNRRHSNTAEASRQASTKHERLGSIFAHNVNALQNNKPHVIIPVYPSQQTLPCGIGLWHRGQILWIASNGNQDAYSP